MMIIDWLTVLENQDSPLALNVQLCLGVELILHIGPVDEFENG